MTNANTVSQALELAMASARTSVPRYKEQVSDSKSREQGPSEAHPSAAPHFYAVAETGPALYSQSPSECPLWGYLARFR